MFKEEFVGADVLVVGGGIAGMMAAIGAADQGAKVVIAEKANTLRSGAGATGNDHFRCYIPEVHGPSVDSVFEQHVSCQSGNGRTTKFARAWLQESTHVVNLWQSWGIPMKLNGEWEFSGHAFPGRKVNALKYAGQKQKPILTREARKRGVNIINRVMVFDLFTDNYGVTGAIGMDAREEKLYILKAKSVFLGTGRCVRLYPSPTPGWEFNRAESPACTGDGRAMAYRAGAELMDMEIPQRWAGNRYLARCGKGTWIGVYRDPQGKAVGPFATTPNRNGDSISDIYHSLFEDYEKSGKGPVYIDGRGMSKEDLDYMIWGLSNEGNLAMVNHLHEEGADFDKNQIEFMTYEVTTRGGIYYNEKGETNLKGLYAAGDEYFGGISAAAVIGWVAGNSAGEYVKHARTPELDSVKQQIEEKKNLLEEIRNREVGATWREANTAVEQVMHDYAGAVRSDTQLEAGLSHLRKLKAKANKLILAKNQHELMHCLEVLNLYEMGELVFVTSLARKETRKETRGSFVRSDYPYTNPLLNNMRLFCKKAGDQIVTEFRKLE